MPHVKGYTPNDRWMLARMKDNCPKAMFEELISLYALEGYSVDRIYHIAYEAHYVPWPPWW